MDIPSQDVITKDNVSLKVSAVLYFRVLDPNRAVVAVENYLFATSQNAQTTLRSVCGEVELDQLLVEREKINAHSSRSSTSIRSRGASRWCRWRSSSSTCPRRCDG